MVPWETQALIEYSCKDFPLWTTQSYLLMPKDEIPKRDKAKYQTLNSIIS